MVNKSRILLYLIVIAYISFGMLTSVIGVVIEQFQLYFGVSQKVAALLPFAFYLAYGFFSIPFGLWMDRKGTRPVLLGGIALMTIGSYVLWVSENYIMVIIMFFVSGIGVTAIQTAGNPFIRNLDKPWKYTSNLTIIIGIGAVGYAFSPIIVPVIQNNGYSWNSIYLLFGLLNSGLLISFSFLKIKTHEFSIINKISVPHSGFIFRNPLVISYALGIFLYVGAEVGTSSYILSFMEDVHQAGGSWSLWEADTFLGKAFPSAAALALGMFWFLQAAGRIFIGKLMRFIPPRQIFIILSAATCLCLLGAVLSPKEISLIFFALTGLFTASSFTAIYSAAIQSFDSHHGAVSGILCTAIVGGAFIGFLVGYIGEMEGMRIGMSINILAFFYVFVLAVFGKGRLETLS